MKQILLLLLISGTIYAADINNFKTFDNKTLAEVEKIKARFQTFDNKTLEEAKTLANKMSYDNITARSVTNVDKSESDGLFTYIFISASIPMDVLQRYVATADENTTFILKGVIGKDPSKIKPTIEFITKLLCNKSLYEITDETICNVASVDINPPLFKTFNVTHVPTILVSRHNSEELTENGNWFKHVGAVPISYVKTLIK